MKAKSMNRFFAISALMLLTACGEPIIAGPVPQYTDWPFEEKTSLKFRAQEPKIELPMDGEKPVFVTSLFILKSGGKINFVKTYSDKTSAEGDLWIKNSSSPNMFGMAFRSTSYDGGKIRLTEKEQLVYYFTATKKSLPHQNLKILTEQAVCPIAEKDPNDKTPGIKTKYNCIVKNSDILWNLIFSHNDMRGEKTTYELISAE